MPQKRLWTPPEDARLRRLRAEGTTWDGIALDLGLGRSAVIERGRRLDARLPTPCQAAEKLARDLLDPRRPPMPPGDPVSWGAITDATWLAGEPYVVPADE